MTNEQKAEIISLMKQHIEDNDNVRVGWAVEQILKSKQQNHILDKVSATITKTDKYIREPANPNFKYDWNIRKNPAYKSRFIHDLKIVIISTILSLAVGITLWLINKNTKQTDTQQIENKLNEIENKLNNHLSDSTKK